MIVVARLGVLGVGGLRGTGLRGGEHPGAMRAQACDQNRKRISRHYNARYTFHVILIRASHIGRSSGECRIFAKDVTRPRPLWENGTV